MKRILTILAVLFATTVFGAEKIVLTETNTVFLNDSVNDQSIARLMTDISVLNQSEDQSPIYLVLNTPGGSVFSGLEFIRFAKASKREIITVTMFAASMGFQIAEALPGARLMTEFGVLMSHRASGGFAGSFNKGEVESRLDFIKSVVQELDVAVAKRSVRFTTEQYQSLIKDEYYALPSKAISDGFADKQVDLICDDTMLGSKFVTYQTIFGPIVAEFAKCPLNPNLISARFQNRNDKNKDKLEFEVLNEIRKSAEINNI